MRLSTLQTSYSLLAKSILMSRRIGLVTAIATLAFVLLTPAQAGKQAVLASEVVSGSVWAHIESGQDDAHHDPVSWPNYSDKDHRVIAGAPGSKGPTYGGWRWNNLGIPEGAVITSAYVELTQQGWGHLFQTELALQNAASPDSFSRESSPFHRWSEKTDFSTVWTWGKDVPNTVIQTPDLTAGIQELVDRYGSLDSVALLESGEGVQQFEHHEWHSFEEDPALAARLHIEWTVEQPTSGTVWAHIDSSNDDAHHDPVSWPNYSDEDSRVLAGSPGTNGPTYGGWRWDDLDIPEGAFITSAYVELTQQGWGHLFQTELALQDEANPTSFSSGSSPFHRWADRTDFSVNWTWGKDVPNTIIQTPDISKGVQELVDRHGALDSIVLLESGEGVQQFEHHEWHSFDKDPSLAARLHIEWTMERPEPQSSEVNWDGIGEVLFVGASLDPTTPTSATAEFTLNEDENIDQVVVTTTNEFVLGLLLGPEGTSAVTDCSDNAGGVDCARLANVLTGSTLASLHTSVATLDVLVEASIPIPVGDPADGIFLNVPIVGGLLTGQIDGAFVISKRSDAALGTASLEIQPGSSGTYACFGITPEGPVPLESLDSCINGTGGQFFPIALDVVDEGSFAIGSGTGALADILGMSGDVRVAATTDLFLGAFGGTIDITDATAVLAPPVE